MEMLGSIAMRAVPAIASALVTYGVTSDHAEPIATGFVLGVVTVIDLTIKWVKGRKRNG